MRDIDPRISVLRDLQIFLIQLSEDILEKSELFKNTILQMQEDGIPAEIADYYEINYGIQSLSYLQNLIANITDNVLPQINANISKLEQTLIWRDTSGNIVAKRIGDRIWDNCGNWIYELRGDRIYDSSGNWRYEIRGDRIYDTAGNWRYELRDDRIYDPTGNWLASES